MSSAHDFSSTLISAIILNSEIFVNTLASSSADWMGHEFDENNLGITAWIGKASAEVQNGSSYAEVNGYLLAFLR